MKALERFKGGVEGFTGSQGGCSAGGVGAVVASDVHGTSLNLIEFGDDGVLGYGKAFGEGGEAGL